VPKSATRNGVLSVAVSVLKCQKRCCDSPREPSLKDVCSRVGFSLESTHGSGVCIMNLLRRLWNEDEGQDIAEYAVMLAVILVLVIGTIRLVGSNANNAFSSVSSSLQ
jgi:Flp pilus assembly pilin Flp